MRVTDICSGGGGMGFPSSHQKGKVYLEEAGGWLEKFHLSFCSPSLAGSCYKAGVGNRCWPGWQQLNPPPATGTECGAWRSSRGFGGRMLNGRGYLRANEGPLQEAAPL